MIAPRARHSPHTLPPGETQLSIDLFDDFGSDAKLEEEGVWETYQEGVEFLIARSGNKKFTRLIGLEVKKHDRLLRQNTDASIAKSDEIMAQVMAESVLLDWRGDFKVKGQPVGPYSKAKAKELLSIKGFRLWVTSVAEDASRYKAELDEAEEKK